MTLASEAAAGNQPAPHTAVGPWSLGVPGRRVPYPRPHYEIDGTRRAPLVEPDLRRLTEQSRPDPALPRAVRFRLLPRVDADRAETAHLRRDCKSHCGLFQPERQASASAHRRDHSTIGLHLFRRLTPTYCGRGPKRRYGHCRSGHVVFEMALALRVVSPNSSLSNRNSPPSSTVALCCRPRPQGTRRYGRRSPYARGKCTAT